nr:hypothetical protein [Geodermatophilaceae bacterium]
AQGSFWLLVAVAVLAIGALSSALAAQPSTLTGVGVAASGLILIASLAFAARVQLALGRARPRARRIPN